jgi:hypothetical protein
MIFSIYPAISWMIRYSTTLPLCNSFALSINCKKNKQMKTIINRCLILFTAMLFSSQLSFGQTATNNFSKTKTNVMKTYVIEREVAGVGKSTAAQLKEMSQKSCSVLKEMGSSIEWVHSYVTGNKIYCVYKAENEELVRRHAKLAGFPCNSVEEVATVISPKTAE